MIPENTAWIGWTAVAGSSRKQGVGSRLLSWLTDKARTLGVDELAVYTSSKYPDAMRLYEKLGFLSEPGRGERLIYRKELGGIASG